MELDTNQLKLLAAVDEVLGTSFGFQDPISPTRDASALGQVLVAALAYGYTFLSMNAGSAEAVIEDDEGERDTSQFMENYGPGMTQQILICLCLAGDVTLIRAAQKFFPLPAPVMVDESNASPKVAPAATHELKALGVPRV